VREILTIARLELVAVSRQRWMRIFAAAFGILAVAASYSSGAIQELGGADGFARTTVALVPLVVALVPLAALLLAVSGQSDEPGEEAFLFTQPISRSTVVFARWLGEAIALAASLSVGFGAGALWLAGSVGWAGLARFGIFVAVSIVLALAFLSLGAAAAIFARRRQTALGIAAFGWFFAVLLYDILAITAAGAIPGRLGARVLFVSVLANPADLARVLSLTLSGTPHVLGAAGDAWLRFLGGPAAATAAACGVLLAWVALPLEAARRWIARRDM
jgi:Cu-processing system permease protein